MPWHAEWQELLEQAKWIYSGLGVTVSGLVVRKWLADRRKRRRLQHVFGEFFEHTDRLIDKRLWGSKASSRLAQKLWVPLSAAIANRIPPRYSEKQPGNIWAGRKIRNLNRFLRSRRRATAPVAITGSPGSGKTFELVTLYSQLRGEFEANTSDWLPLLIFLNELPGDWLQRSRANVGLQSFVSQYLKAAGYSKEVIERVRLQFTSSPPFPMMLLFDALDEIPTKQDYQDAVKVINGFLGSVNSRRWRFVLTCRTSDYDASLELVELELQPLNPRQIASFFRKRRKVTTVEGKYRQQAWSRLHEPTMAWFAPYMGNPYLLALVLESIEDSLLGDRKPPLNLRELFAKTVRRELQKADDSAPGIADDGELMDYFSLVCSLIATLLLERTIGKQEAILDLGSQRDLGDLLARFTADRAKVPHFQEIVNLAGTLTAGPAGTQPSPGVTRVRRVTEVLGLGDFIAFLGSLPAGRLYDQIGAAPGLTQQETLCLTRALASLRERAVLSRDLIAASIFLMTAFRLLQRGVDCRLLRSRGGPGLVVAGFRHRRIFEYFAAAYLDLTHEVMVEKIDNLWHKEALIVLGSISADPRWLFQLIGWSDLGRAVLCAEIAGLLPPESVQRLQEELAAVALALSLQISGSSETGAGLMAFESLVSLMSRRLWMPPPEFLRVIANRASDVAYFQRCLVAWDVLGGRLSVRDHLEFFRFGLRNAISLPLPPRTLRPAD